MKAYLKIFILLSTLIFLSACEERFEESSATILKQKWDESMNHSAASWWYAGESNTHYFLIGKRPLESTGYKVSKMEITVSVKNPQPFPVPESELINLKVGQLVFKTTATNGVRLNLLHFNGYIK